MQDVEENQLELTEAHKRRRKRPSVAIGFWIIKKIEKLLMRYSSTPDAPVLEKADFQWTRQLEADWKTIRAELDRVLHDSDKLPNFQDISPDQYRISPDSRWKTFVLVGFGERSELRILAVLDQLRAKRREIMQLPTSRLCRGALLPLFAAACLGCGAAAADLARHAAPAGIEGVTNERDSR